MTTHTAIRARPLSTAELSDLSAVLAGTHTAAPRHTSKTVTCIACSHTARVPATWSGQLCPACAAAPAQTLAHIAYRLDAAATATEVAGQALIIAIDHADAATQDRYAALCASRLPTSTLDPVKVAARLLAIRSDGSDPLRMLLEAEDALNAATAAWQERREWAAVAMAEVTREDR